MSHLLNHRAGIPHRVTESEEESQPLTAADMVERVKQAELMFEPGEKSVYSSAGYSVLARIVELIEGKSYSEVLQERIFARAEMKHSLDPGARQLVPDRASSYIPAATGVLNTEPKDLTFLVGAGSVFSTAGDVHNLIQAVLDGRLGQSAPLALLRDNGLRWNGITNGYRAFADYYKDTGVEVIFTGNLHTGAADLVRSHVPDIVAGKDVPPPDPLDFKPRDVDEAILAGYEGVYQSDRGQKFTLTVRSGTVYAGNRLLVPTSDKTFYSLQDYGRVNVVFDDQGGVERLDWEWGDEFWPWRRIADAEE